MKKKTKLIIALAVACAGTLVLGACSNGYDGAIYKQGGDVRVTFDENGGRIAGQEGVSVIYYFKHENVENGFELHAPDDGNYYDSMNVRSVTRSGYFLAGWYSERNLRTNANGEPVDEDGNVCHETPVLDEDGNQKKDEDGKPMTALLSENGKPQGYVYANRWDFEGHKRLTMNDVKKGEEKYYDLTLYAAWVPNYTYRIFAENGNKWEVVATATFNPVDSGDMSSIPVPTLNEETGGMDNGKFPSVIGKTFTAAYATSDKTEALDKIEHKGRVDQEKGIAIDGIADYYCEFRDGVWFEVKTAKQFADGFQVDSLNACFDVKEDLDFTDVSWPNQIITGSYGGTILGNGHTFSNITAEYNGVDASAAGLFGNLLAGARIENVTFDNVTFSLKRGSRLSNASFGLFAGNVNAAAKFENVVVNGTFNVGTESENVTESFNSNVEGGTIKYTIRALVGNMQSVNGITANIDVKAVGKVNLELDNVDGSYKATVSN